jgi:hypothetical protein
MVCRTPAPVNRTKREQVPSIQPQPVEHGGIPLVVGWDLPGATRMFLLVHHDEAVEPRYPRPSQAADQAAPAIRLRQATRISGSLFVASSATSLARRSGARIRESDAPGPRSVGIAPCYGPLRGAKGPLPIARLVMLLLEKQTFTHGG